MKAIFSSKLYRASSRQSHIVANMNSRINVELIEQLENVLAPSEDNQKVKVNNEVSNNKHKSGEKEVLDVSDKSNIGPLDFESREPSLQMDQPDESQEPDAVDEPPDVLEDEPEVSLDLEGTVESGVEIETELSSGDIQAHVSNNLKDGSLSRVAIKNDEVWCYFDDSTNLNRILNEVLEIIESDSRYNNLSFSRLARSDNAVVFDIKD